jgi:hypothetical protein
MGFLKWFEEKFTGAVETDYARSRETRRASQSR